MNRDEIVSVLLDIQSRLKRVENMLDPKAKGTRGECIGYAIDLGLPPADGEAFFDVMESNGWLKKGKVPVRDWRATMRTWKRNGWMDSQRQEKTNGNGFIARI